MIVVIDTNALLQALGNHSHVRPLLDAWFSGRLMWAMSNDIQHEYEEIITRRSGAARWQRLEMMLDLVAGTRPETLRMVTPTFRSHQIIDDPDDDKFVDCAIAAEADYIITSDHHFDVLIGSGYKPQPITPEEFIRRHVT